MPEAVIFDIDGTLLDSVDQHAEAWKQAFEHFGYSFPFCDIRYQIGKGGDKLLAAFLTPEQIERQGQDLEKYRGDLFKSDFLSKCKPFPGVRELFLSVKAAGRKIALATSGKKDEVKVYEKILSIGGLSDAVVTKDDVEESKPAPDVLEVAMHKLGGIPADRCVFIGDTPHDAEAATKAKMPIIGVLCGGFPEKDLREAGAGDIYQDVEDLRKRWKP